MRDWSPHSFDGANVLSYSEQFYTKPQFRFPPYAVGMLTVLAINSPIAAFVAEWSDVVSNAVMAAASLSLFFIK